MGEKTIRIYVGGLGASVQEDDLKKTFGSLGRVESVELNRNKGRSFGYMEFVPASDKALVKLFSAYNGCMWKGGKLKLEKAKEHYLSRLKREWAEDSELAIKLASQNVEPDEVTHAPLKFKADQDIEKMQLRVYFPKLRKIKPLPLKGTGKHKYSFQRIEVPPLPINFCDCEEHSAPITRNTKEFFRPPVSAERNDTNDIEPEAFVVTEEELGIMKSVLNKLAEKENRCSKISNESKFTEKINHLVTSDDNSQVVDSEEGQVSDHDDDDDDDVVINVVGRSSNRVDPFEDWQPKTPSNQDSLSIEMESLTSSQKTKLQHDKKRKASASETETNDNRASKRMMNNDNMSSNNVLKATELSSAVASVRKTAWKNLVTEKGSTSFQISDILTDLNPEESKPEYVAPCMNNKDRQDERTDKTKELESLCDDQSKESAESESQSEESAESESRSKESAESESQSKESAESESQSMESAESESQSKESSESESQSKESAESESHDDQTNEKKKLEMPSVVNEANKSSESDSKSARGAAWLHKLSWTQLVGDASSRSFNLSEILTGGTSEKQELPKFETNVFPDSKDQNFLIGDTSKPHGGAEEALVEKQDDADMDEDKITSDGDKKVEQNNRAFVRDIVISKTCPFMRSAASMKEWAKTKAALSGSLKKRVKVKEMDSD